MIFLGFVNAFLQVLAIIGIILVGGFVIFFLGDLVLSVLDPNYVRFGKRKKKEEDENETKQITGPNGDTKELGYDSKEFTFDDEDIAEPVVSSENEPIVENDFFKDENENIIETMPVETENIVDKDIQEKSEDAFEDENDSISTSEDKEKEDNSEVVEENDSETNAFVEEENNNEEYDELLEEEKMYRENLLKEIEERKKNTEQKEADDYEKIFFDDDDINVFFDEPIEGQEELSLTQLNNKENENYDVVEEDTYETTEDTNKEDKQQINEEIIEKVDETNENEIDEKTRDLENKIADLQAKNEELEKKLEENQITNLQNIELKEYEDRLQVLKERLNENEKDLRKVKKEYIPLRKVYKTLESDERKLRRKEALVAKQKVVLYGVNNIADIDEEKAKKLSEELDLLEGLKLSVKHCEEVIEANKERFPILENTYNILMNSNQMLKDDIKETEEKIAKIKQDQD